MTFSGAFVPTFSGVFDRGAATRPWWNPGGTFTAVAAYQAKGAASLSASYTNLVTPGTYDAAPGVEPTWAAGTGWTFDGSTQYLTTGVIPTSTYSLIARFDNASGNYAMVCGQIKNGASLFLNARDFANHVYGVGSEKVVSGALTSGVMAATTIGYLDGIAKTTPGTWTTTTDNTIAIGRSNGFILYFTGNIQAVAIYSTTLSATQVATLTTQMNAL